MINKIADNNKVTKKSENTKKQNEVKVRVTKEKSVLNTNNEQIENNN